jgi:hypothetical protein
MESQMNNGRADLWLMIAERIAVQYFECELYDPAANESCSAHMKNTYFAGEAGLTFSLTE